MASHLNPHLFGQTRSIGATLHTSLRRTSPERINEKQNIVRTFLLCNSKRNKNKYLNSIYKVFHKSFSLQILGMHIFRHSINNLHIYKYNCSFCISINMRHDGRKKNPRVWRPKKVRQGDPLRQVRLFFFTSVRLVPRL